ncbi:MAG: LON peptidase substrate-binding domain-containing protein [Lewinellaceae bacterium]|nr:LON peptidase substrate-binding domain-containing protein [Lewinellaceae bacterium]
MSEELLPQFPLQLVVFPNEHLNLHIFEPRYKQLIRECEASGTSFGIPVFMDGKVQGIGTEVALSGIEKYYASGELDIRTQGVKRYRILEFINPAPGKLYAAARVTLVEEEDPEPNPVLQEQLFTLVTELFSLLEIDKPLPASPSQLFTFPLGHFVGFSLLQEYEFLQLTSEVIRQTFLLDHLQRLLPVVREMNRLQERARLNGHFRHLQPPKF